MSTSHTESTNKTEQRVPIGDGWSNDTRATASCYCGAIQIEFVSLLVIGTIVPRTTVSHAFFPLISDT